MHKIFELITDDDIAHCIKVWALSVNWRHPAKSFNESKRISQLKAVISQSADIEQIKIEAKLALENGNFALNSTLIDEIFNYLDATLLH